MEKVEVVQQERVGTPDLSPSTRSLDKTEPDVEAVAFDEKTTKRLLRRLDLVLMPFLSLLYLLSFLDRTNIGNARLAGLEASLGMKGLDYNIALMIFFPTYVIAEVPSNMMMKYWKPSLWIPTIMVAWAIITTCMGLVTNNAGLLATRALLGLAEGGLFPGIAYYITMWYRRHECGFRMAIFFSAATAAGAFGGLLARAISTMEGVGGKGGWAWIFIIEGILTFIVAVAAFWVMQDYPDTAKFLKPHERVEVVRRLEQDRSHLANEFDMKYMWQAFKDWKIWVHMFITLGVYTCVYSVSLFLPSIVRTLGYTNNDSQLMTVPPYVVACFFCIFCNWMADKQKQRGVWMIGCCVTGIIGFTMLIASDDPKVKYIGCFFAASGIYPNVPAGVAWNGNNIGGSTKRGVGIAMHVGCGNLGGCIAAFLFQSQQGPRFYQGYGVLIGMLTMASTLSAIMTVWCRRENARRDREYKPLAEYSREELEAEREKGDEATFYRYTI